MYSKNTGLNSERYYLNAEKAENKSPIAPSIKISSYTATGKVVP